MLERIPKKILSLSGYFISSAVSKLMMFLALPVITNYLSVTEYGRWNIFNTIIMFAIPFSGLMMRTHLTRIYFTETMLKKQLVASTVLLSNLLLSFLFILPIAILSLNVNEVFGIPTKYLYILPPILFFNNIKEILLLILRYEKKITNYVFFELVYAFLNIGLILTFIFNSNLGWELILYAFSGSLILTSCYGLYYLFKKKYLKLSFEMESLQISLSVGIPLLPHALGTAVITMSDRLILEKMLGLEAVGIYSVAYVLGTAMSMCTGAFNKMWGPWLMEKLSLSETTEIKKMIVRKTYLYYIATTLLVFLLSFLSFIYIKYFLASIYQSSFSITVWVLCGLLFQGFYFAIFHYMVFLGKTKIFSVITIIASIINIIANVYLIEKYGIVGAAQATFLSYVFIFISLFLHNQKKYPMPWLSFSKRVHR